MMKRPRYILLLLLPLFVACGGRNRVPVTTLRAEHAQARVDFSGNLLEAGLSDTVDLGVIHAGEKVRCEMTFHNAGDQSLVILSVNSSCGCTRVDFPASPIPAGTGGPFAFTFDSRGFSGFQFKTISVLTSVSPRPYRLIVTGEVR